MSTPLKDSDEHHNLWLKYFVKPVAHFMRQRGIKEFRVRIGDDSKVNYLLEPDPKWKPKPEKK